MPDYMYMLESRLSAEQRAAVVRLQELSAETGFNVYLTGDAVRDLLSGMIVRDLDFTIEGNPLRLARELEKGGARIVEEDEKLRQVEMIFSGDVDGSIAAARDEVYSRPGTKPEIRWSTIMEDLRRRDFSINAIAISLNLASRGLLLDPTNGLADLEKGEVRALSIHSFTNQPARLLRGIRYAARMGSKLEPRTEERFALALERGLQESIPPVDAGRELRQLAREDKPASVLKAWEAQGLMGTFHPQLARRHPDYEILARILRARDDLITAGLRPRLLAPVLYAVLRRLKPGGRTATLHHLGYRSREIEAVLHLEVKAKKVVKMLTGSKTKALGDAFAYLANTPPDLLALVMAAKPNSKALSKIRNYLQKWRPLRQALPSAVIELELLGFPRGQKFDKVIEELFHLQLAGKGRTPEDRTRVLRKLSGIKEPPKEKSKEEKKKRPIEKPEKPQKPQGPPMEKGRSMAPSAPSKPAASAKTSRSSLAMSDKGKKASSRGAAKRAKAGPEMRKSSARRKRR